MPLWHPAYLRIFTQALRICRQGRFTPREAFWLGLFHPDFDCRHLDNFVSRNVTTKLQKAVNPESWEPLLKNKDIFYRYLMAQGLPIPQLYGIFFQKVPGWSAVGRADVETSPLGWSPNGEILAGRADWERFLMTIPADEFVIKPCRGAFGEGIKIFTRVSDAFKDTNGSVSKTADIYDLMRANTGIDAFVIQERLRNHPEMCRLNPSEFLQTVRIGTFIDRKGNFRILFAYVKLISGRNITDNLRGGRSGNMLALVRTEDGTLGPGRITCTDGRGAKLFDKHPQTGVEFNDFHIPRWAEVTAIVKEAAYRFLPLRTIGWDIAITPSDIKIVEGNIWWNPRNPPMWRNIIEDELPYDF